MFFPFRSYLRSRRLASFKFFFLTALAGIALTGTTVAAPPLILIDPGHGGSSVAGSLNDRNNSSPNNAQSPSGLKEKNLTLEFSLILKEQILKRGNARKISAGVLLTREDDRNINFTDRAKICAREDTVCVVSIHFNASSGGQKGSLAMINAQKRNANYAADREFARGLSTACHKGVAQFVNGSRDLGLIEDGHLHGGLGSNFFFQMARHKVLKDVPKCFLEVEFIDNSQVDRELLQRNRKEKFEVIAASIADYLLDYASQR